MGILSKWVESLDYEYEILNSCIRHRSPRSTCEECVKSCPENAISIHNSKPEIDNKKCTECGQCISACPVQAVAGIYPNRTIKQGQLVITDNEHIPTVKELLILYKKGIHSIVSETEPLEKQWEKSIEQANSILIGMDEEPFNLVFGRLKEEEYVCTRRELFSLWKKESKSIVKIAAPAKWRFNQEDFDLSKYYKDFQFASISLNIEKCTLCKACQKLCVKECFVIDDEQFSISPQECSNCQLCADVCPEQVLSVEHQISRKNDTYYSVYEKVCSSCQKPFQTMRKHDEQCFICKKRDVFRK